MRDIESVVGYFTTATISVIKITVGEGTDDEKANATLLADYAGTYAFTCTPTGQYYCSVSAPTNVTGENSLATMSQSAIDVTVTISNVGAVSVTVPASGQFAVSVRGSDTIHDGSESGSFTWVEA